VDITVWPYQRLVFVHYAANRPVCEARPATRAGQNLPRPDPATCSTDELAFYRTHAEIRIGGRPLLVQSRPSGEWRLVDRTGGLVPADLDGLVNADNDGVGVIDESFAGILQQTAGSSLTRRLLPAPTRPTADAVVDLTIDPALQHVAASALRVSGPDGPPLAGGIVAIDATTGRVLVAASAPAHTRVTAPPDPGSGDANGFVDTHGEFGRLDGDALDGSQFDPDCPADGYTADAGKCWRWQDLGSSSPPATDDPADLRRYVNNDRSVTALPRADVNRAVGQSYGLGSTFKVVIAAAYLNLGYTPEERIPAPETLELSPTVVIHNFGGGICPGADDGYLTLSQALSVSCNTAFVHLAQMIGWPAIAQQAARFGITVGSCADQPWVAYPLFGGADTCVPSQPDGIAIGNDALGGQDVQGTPLEMATVMAAVANSGTVIQPTFVDSITDPLTGATTTPVQIRRSAVPSDVDAELTDALSHAAVDPTGTAHGLARDVGVDHLWVKTGTHEVVPAGQSLAEGSFVRVDSWIVGFIQTAHGPVSFAVVAEARDETAGGQRVRYLARLLLQAIKSRT
jgi:cell division protein FtsI/penicillin-binding protein 2